MFLIMIDFDTLRLVDQSKVLISFVLILRSSVIVLFNKLKQFFHYLIKLKFTIYYRIQFIIDYFLQFFFQNVNNYEFYEIWKFVI